MRKILKWFLRLSRREWIHVERERALIWEMGVRPVLLWGMGKNFHWPKDLLKYDFEEAMVIKLKCSVSVPVFYVLQPIFFNVPMLLLQWPLTSISVALVPEILITLWKAWVIRGHHDSFYYHFYLKTQENSPLDIPGYKHPFLGIQNAVAKKSFMGREREENASVTSLHWAATS